MSEPITESKLFEAVQQIQASITTAVVRIEEKLDAHAKDDLAVANRVLVIETERSAEKSQAVKRGTWVAFLASAGMTALWKVLDHFNK